jgi:prepilin-type N-terminal cleavage/methylation domain-containing protein
MRYRKGFNLVEVMVAMAILLVGLIGIAGQWPTGAKLVVLSGQESEATVVAERFLEELEGMSYADVEQMRPETGSINEVLGRYRLDYALGTGPVPNTIEVNVVVSWYLHGRMYSIRMGTIVAADL